MTAPDTLPSLSVVVPTHGRGEQVLRMVAGLLAEPALDEVVIAVDGADPDLEQRLAALDDERLRVVVMARNVGQSAAREAGARVASGELVLLVDDDVELSPGTIAGHARLHAEQPGHVVVGHNPVALPDCRRAGMAATYLYATEYDQAWQDLLADDDLVLDRLWAGHLSLGRQTYLEVAGHVWPVRYHEDQDLGRRLRAAGLRGVAAPHLTSRHHHSRTLAQSVEEARRQGEALALLAQRWPDRPPPEYATRPGPMGLLTLLGTPVANRAVVAAATLLAAAAAGRGRWDLETRALRLARQSTLRRALAEGLARSRLTRVSP